MLFLRDSAKRVLYSFLERQEPRLFTRYKALYDKRAYTETQYQKRTLAVVESLKEKYGYSSRPEKDLLLESFSRFGEGPGMFEEPDLFEGQC